MKNQSLIIFFTIIVLSWQASHAAQGKILGEESYSLPGWFKQSFLELKEDAAEARQDNRKVMLFMHIDRCPYCTRMLHENFLNGNNKHYIKSHFDVIALNIRGDREVTWLDGNVYTEKKLAKLLRVMATPAIVFLDKQARKIYQMNGYRKPAEFRNVMEYVSAEHYHKMRLDDFIISKQKENYTFREHPLFVGMPDPSHYQGPLAIIVEDQVCLECDDFHQQVLQQPQVMSELKKLKVVRIDARSTKPIILPSGKRVSPKDWVKKIKLDYRPATLLYDKGKLIERLEGRLYQFHYKELLRFVSGGYYQQYKEFLPYLADRQKSLLSSGVDIHVGK